MINAELRNFRNYIRKKGYELRYLEINIWYKENSPEFNLCVKDRLGSEHKIQANSLKNLTKKFDKLQ